MSWLVWAARCRCFTLVYYLNSSWDETAGGALRVHMPTVLVPAGSPPQAVDILPHGDTFVLFRADRLVHEVRPAHKPRFAVTLWIYAGNKRQQAASRRAS